MERLEEITGGLDVPFQCRKDIGLQGYGGPFRAPAPAWNGLRRAGLDGYTPFRQHILVVFGASGVAGASADTIPELFFDVHPFETQVGEVLTWHDLAAWGMPFSYI
jgi:hypothetical protein